MITEPTESELTVSLNFWFTPMRQMLQPSLPLSPWLRVEFARQLEFLICDTLADQPRLVAAFCAALAAQLEAVADGSCDARAVAMEGSTATQQCALGRSSTTSMALWQELEVSRPADVDDVAAWRGLFEYVTSKMAHVLGAHQVRAFVRDLLHTERFVRLARVDRSPSARVQ